MLQKQDDDKLVECVECYIGEQMATIGERLGYYDEWSEMAIERASYRWL